MDGGTILFSGDLGNSPQRIVRPTDTPSSSQTVVMESTYGDREHINDDAQEILQKEINTVEETSATLLVPAFALNRTQDLLNRIKHLKSGGKVKQETRVYLDSPMAISATSLYLKHKELFNKKLLEESREGGVFDFPGLTISESSRESKKIKKTKGAKVIIAGSGMMTGGRIASHAANYLPMESTRLLIVGYQGEDTLGREITEGAKRVNIYGEKVDVNASIKRIHSMSSHAGRSALIEWYKNIKGVQKLILTHGEDVARISLKEKIHQEKNTPDILLPKINEEHQVK